MATSRSVHPGRSAKLAAWISGGIYTIALWLAGISLQSTVVRILAFVPPIIGFAVFAFDKWIWKWPFVHALTGRPRIDGSWIGTLQPTDKSDIPPGGNRGPIEVGLVIEQTFWSVAVTLYTAESRSLSTSATLLPDGDGGSSFVLAYTYANVPRAEHRDRSHPHAGAARIAVTGAKPCEIDGTYWTDRLTMGSMDLRFVDHLTSHGSLKAIRDAEASGRGTK